MKACKNRSFPVLHKHRLGHGVGLVASRAVDAARLRLREERRIASSFSDDQTVDACMHRRLVVPNFCCNIKGFDESSVSNVSKVIASTETG